MSERLFVTVCEVAIGVAVVTALIIILLATWYDFRAALVKKQHQQASSRLNKRRQPFVTIVIYTNNHASSIEHCLRSISVSHYSHYRIVVADHKSADTTRQIVKAYQKSHPKQLIALYTARGTHPRNEVIQRAIKKLPSSDYTMIIDGSTEITDITLRNAIANFTINDSLRRLELRDYSVADPTIRSLVPQFTSLTKNIIFKALTVIHLLPSTNSSVSIVKQISNGSQRYYASTVTYSRDKSPPQTKSSTIHLLIILIVCILVISIVGYWMWTAATLRSNLLLTLSWMVLVILLLAIIWSDNLIKISRKIELTITVPFMYFILYVQALNGFFKSIWNLIRRYPYQKLIDIFKAELHSTNF